MSQQDSEFFAKARQARDKLADQFLSHPEVTLIDIGYKVGPSKPIEQLVLRVHVRQPADQQALSLPKEVDGIPVQVVIGDYRPQ